IDKLVRCYRQARSVPGDLEQRLSHQFTPNWDSLTLMQKVESFEYAQANTSGDDLQRIMWYRSPNSEEWLARRTNYTRSLAVMSMAGYILGLGDRHPNNVLIHERTGKVVHIDLGDCFESAAQRDRFPEKVPFRLTRMLIKAMGVTGIEGAFRRSAYHTIRVLRANRDSMMAVLEAFVFDPLMTWVSIREPDEDPDRAPDTQQRPRQQCDNLMAHSMAGGNSAAGSTWVRQVARIGGLGASTYVAPNRKWQDGNSKALAIVKRIHDKLVGCDFDRSVRLGENKQVEKLIQQATSVDNLVVLYSGWLPPPPTSSLGRRGRNAPLTSSGAVPPPTSSIPMLESESSVRRRIAEGTDFSTGGMASQGMGSDLGNINEPRAKAAPTTSEEVQEERSRRLRDTLGLLPREGQAKVRDEAAESFQLLFEAFLDSFEDGESYEMLADGFGAKIYWRQVSKMRVDECATVFVNFGHVMAFDERAGHALLDNYLRLEP
ncbi:phosphatidylinositol kinase- protein kinase tor1, partial [Coemansia nantahalensis]